MTQLLKTYLQMAYGGMNEQKRLAARLPKDLRTPAHVVREMGSSTPKRVRELLMTENVYGTGLVQTEVYNTVLEGSQPAKCWRNLLDIIPMKGKTAYVPIGATGVYAAEVPDGSEAPILNENLTYVTLTAKKYAGRPLCTEEMVQDADIDVMERHIKYAGEAMENRLNQLCIDAILLNCTTSFDTAGSNQGIKAFAKAMAALKGAGHMATDACLEPSAYGAILSDNNNVGAYYPGSQDGTNTQGNAMLKILMVNSGVYGGTYTKGTYTWRYTTDNDIGMIVMDRRKAGLIGMRRDLYVENYNDAIRGLVGAKVAIRCGPNYGVPTASCRVLY